MNGNDVELIRDVREELNGIEIWINNGNNRTDKKVKYLISYSVIKASGTVEMIFKRMLYEELSQRATKENKNYLQNKIVESSCNPDTGNISRLLQDMSNEWKCKFEKLVKNEAQKQKSELNSLVQWRNDFAHGGSITTSIRSVKKSFEAGIVILKILDRILKGEE